MVVDLTDDDAPQRVIDGATTAHGPIHGLFVSHGGPPPGARHRLDDDALATAVEVSLRAPIRLVRDVAASMHAGGAIAVLTSSSSVQPIPGLASSNATRPAVWGYCKTLADELGPRGIRVNVVLPGRYDTARLRELEATWAERDGTTTDQVRADAAAEASPCGGWASPPSSAASPPSSSPPPPATSPARPGPSTAARSAACDDEASAPVQVGPPWG